MKKHNLIKDILWYFIGNIIPLLAGFFKSSIYTRTYSPEDFGAYTLVVLTFTYLSVACYSWITSCAWRFHFQYQKEGKTTSLYSNLLFLFVTFSIIILAISLAWYEFSDVELIKRLIFLCFLQFFTSELSSFFLVIPRLENKSFYYNTIQTIRAAGSFGLLILLTFVFGYGIEAFLISNIILNILLLLVIIIPKYFKLIKPRQIRKEDLSTFVGYGKIGLVVNMCTMLLISSDRFLIEYFTGLKEVGIYNQNYNIAQITIAVLVNTYWSALNPYILPEFEKKSEASPSTLSAYFKLYFFCFFPIAIYFVLYAKEIANIMLGEDFRIGYQIIYWIAISEFIIGMHFLPVLRMKFNNNFRILSACYIIAFFLNVGLNVLLIPILGYQIAAVTTIFVNILLLWYFLKQDHFNYFSGLIRLKAFKQCILVLFLQILFHVIIRIYKPSITYSIFEGIVFIGIYVILAVRYQWIQFGFTDVYSKNNQ